MDDGIDHRRWANPRRPLSFLHRTIVMSICEHKYVQMWQRNVFIDND